MLPTYSDFSYTQSEDSLAVQFENLSSGADSVTWSFGDNSGTRTDDSPLHLYRSPGRYVVRLVVVGEGGRDSATRVVQVDAVEGFPVPIVTLEATPESRRDRGEVRLTWTVEHATHCVGKGGAFAGEKAEGGGFLDLNVGADTIFRLECEGPSGAAATSLPYFVDEDIPPSVKLSASEPRVIVGSEVDLTWEVTDAQSCVASGGEFKGLKAESGGKERVRVGASTTYRLECNGAGGFVAAEVDVAGLIAFESAGVAAIPRPTRLSTFGLASHLRLSWTVDEPDQVAFYEVHVDPDGVSGYSLLDVNRDGSADFLDRIDGSTPEARVFVRSLHLTDFRATRYLVVAYGFRGEEIARSPEITSVDLEMDPAIQRTRVARGGDRTALSADGKTLLAAVRSVTAPRVGVYRRGASTGVWLEVASLFDPVQVRGRDIGSHLAVSADGRVIAVGSNEPQSVYIFEAIGNTRWERKEEPEITSPNPIVALSGSGSRMAVASSVGFGFRIFERDPEGNWTEEDETFASVIAGRVARLSMSGDGGTLAVAAPDEGPGLVAVFERSEDGSWVEVALLEGVGFDDEFGRDVRLAEIGALLVVGAPGASGSRGRAIAFERQIDGSWIETAALTASNADVGDAFGSGLGLSRSGDLLVVGAPGEDGCATEIDGDPSSNACPDRGAAYVFGRMGPADGWEQSRYLKVSTFPGLVGSSVELSGDGRELFLIGDPTPGISRSWHAF